MNRELILLPHQQRVVEEKAELAIKIDKLGAFVDAPLFQGLQAAEQVLLLQQLHYMGKYLNVLTKRITAFTGA
jgi:hypothetical protein